MSGRAISVRNVGTVKTIAVRTVQEERGSVRHVSTLRAISVRNASTARTISVRNVSAGTTISIRNVSALRTRSVRKNDFSKECQYSKNVQ
jgi:hypothetical protein